MIEQGKIFYLSSDQELIQKQLNYQSVRDEKGLRFEENVSTDAIFPTRGVTAEYSSFGHFALSGFKGVKEGDLDKVKPEVLVVGNGFGSGSSREHAPISLKLAGVKKIVCLGRVEKIFLENCLMSGIEVYEYPKVEGVVSDIEDLLVKGRLEQVYQDKLRPDITKVGGLSTYNLMRLDGRVEPIRIKHDEVQADYPMTAVEKILAAKMVNVDPNKFGEKIVKPGDTGFVRLNYRMSYELHAPITKTVLENELKGNQVINPETVHLFQDHSALIALNPKFAQLISLQKEMGKKYGLKIYSPASGSELTEGICHTISVEKTLIKPGEVGVGTDSHTCSLGVLNTLAYGIGATHFANTLVTNEALVEVPKTVKIDIIGEFKSGVTPKDLMLVILSQDFVKNGISTNTVFEYDGEGLDGLGLDQQMVLTNMAVEGRAMTGIIARLTPALKDHLSKTVGMNDDEINEKFVKPDFDAIYFKKIEIDLGKIEPMVALPGDPRNGIPLSKLEEKKVDNVYVGSCTGGNLNDLAEVAKVLKGKKLAEGVQMHVQAASEKIFQEAGRLGYLDIINEAGGEIIGFGCGACIGLGPGRVPDLPLNDFNDYVTVSATNRNFDGRMGGKSPVYLTSPSTAAIAAVDGKIGGKRR